MEKQENKIYSALVRAQASFEPVIYDKVNPHFKNKFASLAAIRKATQKALSENGIAVIQPWTHADNGDIIIHTKIIHESGECIDSSCVLTRQDKTDQQVGSSITYNRRYQMASILGVSGEEDDDAEVAEGRGYTGYNKKPEQLSKKNQTSSKEAASEAISLGKPFQNLKSSMEAEGIDTTRLEEWVSLRCQSRGQSPDDTVKECNNRFQKFKESFVKWSENVPT